MLQIDKASAKKNRTILMIKQNALKYDYGKCEENIYNPNSLYSLKLEILYCFCSLLIKGSISPNLKIDETVSCCLVLLVLEKTEIMYDET